MPGAAEVEKQLSSWETKTTSYPFLPVTSQLLRWAWTGLCLDWTRTENVASFFMFQPLLLCSHCMDIMNTHQCSPTRRLTQGPSECRPVASRAWPVALTYHQCWLDPQPVHAPQTEGIGCRSAACGSKTQNPTDLQFIPRCFLLQKKITSFSWDFLFPFEITWTRMTHVSQWIFILS